MRERDVAAVLIAGDLFDSPDPPNDVRIAAAETIRRVVEGGVPVFVVPGNHDALTIHPNPYREGLGGATIFREPVFATASVEVDGRTLRVHGVAYDPAACRNPLGTLPALDDPDGFATATTACYPGSFAAVDLTEEGPKGPSRAGTTSPGGSARSIRMHLAERCRFDATGT